MKEVKLYSVEFNQYTNCLKNAVAKYYSKDLEYADYIHIPFGGLIVREDELSRYKDYGNGFSETKFVGQMLVEEE